MDIGNFPAINKQENDKRCIKSPMCRAKKDGVKLLDQLTLRLIDPGASFKCQACRGEPSCASSSTSWSDFVAQPQRVLGEMSLAFRGDEMAYGCSVLLLESWISFWQFRMNTNLILLKWSEMGKEHLHPKDVTLWCGRSLECRLKHSEHLWAIKILSSCQLYSRY